MGRRPGVQERMRATEAGTRSGRALKAALGSLKGLKGDGRH